MRSVVLVSGDIFKDDRIDAVSQVFKGRKSRFETVGWLVSVWASVLKTDPSGRLGYTRMAEIASQGLSGRLKVKTDLVACMIDAGLLRKVDSETVEVVGWEEWTGSIPKKRKKKAERQRRYRQKNFSFSEKKSQVPSVQATENTQDTHAEEAKCRRLHEPNVDVYIAQAPENKERRGESSRRLRGQNVDVYTVEEGDISMEGYVNQDVGRNGAGSGAADLCVSKLEYSNLINYNYNSIRSTKDQLIDSTIDNSIDSIKSNSNSTLTSYNKKKKNTQKKEKPAVVYSAGVADVESGVCDLWPKKVSSKHCDVLEAFASIHSECWDVKTSSKSQGIKKMAKQIILTDGYSPSDVCKAIRGMATDTWPERKKFNGWTYLAKHFEKWLGMYSEGSSASEAGSWGPWRDEGFATKEDWEEYHGRR